MGGTVGPVRRTPQKLIYNGNDADTLADLAQKVRVAEALAEGGDLLRAGDDLPSADAERDALNVFIDEAATRAFAIGYQHIGSKRFRALVLDHPPRQIDGPPDDEGNVKQIDHPDDAPWGVNVETFPMALLTYRDDEDDSIRTIVEPDLSPAQLRRLLEVELSEGDLADLWVRALLLNRGGSADPKEASVALSMAGRSSRGTSSSPPVRE